MFVTSLLQDLRQFHDTLSCFKIYRQTFHSFYIKYHVLLINSNYLFRSGSLFVICTEITITDGTDDLALRLLQMVSTQTHVQKDRRPKIIWPLILDLQSFTDFQKCSSMRCLGAGFGSFGIYWYLFVVTFFQKFHIVGLMVRGSTLTSVNDWGLELRYSDIWLYLKSIPS